ncbi:uncharacterized protein BDZ99DRAFT_560864 [Mytilinidion resinicola]|uniref:Uncharacterized protein n=1 Tax=Mytilinidion resinicola TaxID=574789 RepID=A0A6A6YPC6_9PEZI|nr:uncharacterized protein BDZ99DRAFT_560864 [Mytilinidion resinicola]KAF2810630.1 hypothetical protein BDZ99DRAFT_560864 [Mytilinidion resinicola]
MTAGLMRRLSSSTRTRAHRISVRNWALTPLRQPQRTLANIKDTSESKTWFTSNSPRFGPPDLGGNDHTPPDERTLKLGKTIRVLHDRLPTLLASPLPQEILSPQISLHLFPSTHPHLPTVRGKIPYTTALWTAPVAWGRVPIIGNVKLIILSERMVQNGGTFTEADMRHEKLIVRWKTCGKSKGAQTGGLYRGIGASEQVDKITEFLGGAARKDEEFCGLFIFEFDEEGRISSHTIEHAEEGGSWDKTTRVISVTDWLLGRAWGKKSEDGTPGLAMAQEQRDDIDQHRRR